MYCRKCPRRASCVAVCEKLEAHLRSREVYQREICLEPRDLALVAEAVGVTWSDLLPEGPWMWDRLSPHVNGLPGPLLRVFMLHFYEGRGVAEISRRLRISRATVNRRLGRAVRELRRMAREAPAPGRRSPAGD
jgi:DNA-directed RNA polymerase specialized sigma24 family protein